MKENKHIYPFFRTGLVILGWCLFATTLMNASVVWAEESEEFVYDSSIQRSNFLSIRPDYESQLEEALKDRRAKFFWKFRFDAQSLETESNINSQWAGATFRSKFDYQFLESLQFKSKVNLQLRSGRTQDLFGDLEANNSINARQVVVQWKPLGDYLQVDMGVIPQRFFNQPLFLSNLGFPGASQRLALSRKRFEVALRTQQLIPTSFTQGTRVTERESVPWFYTESLEANFTATRNNLIFGRVTHFRYQNLPAIVAYNGLLYGNTVFDADERNSRFIYGFEGFMTQVGGEQRISDSLSAQLHWDTIVNNEAPSNAGEAQSIRLGAAYDMGRSIIGARYVDFFIESDAVPGAYNSYFFGHNNRIGNAYEINYESKDWGVMFRARYTDADLLSESPIRSDGLQQDNQQTFYFSVETMYDFI